MPDFHYTFHNPANCGAGTPGNLLAGAANPIAIGYAELFNAQLRLGVYPPGWVIDEIHWRIYSFMIGFQTIAAAGVAIPGAAPAVGAAPGAPVPGAAANLPPSPVATGVDSTEKGQIGYHIGTAVGGHLTTYLDPGAAACTWFSFHLSRAIANNGAFTFVGNHRPDIVAFSLVPATGNWHDLVVWENKGHCGNFGAAAAMAPALGQAQALTHCTAFPGGMGWAYHGGPWAVDAHLASQVDVVHGNYRVQVIDPPSSGKPPVRIEEPALTEFLRAYYSPFIEVLSQSPSRATYDERTFHVIDLPKRARLGNR